MDNIRAELQKLRTGAPSKGGGATLLPAKLAACAFNRAGAKSGSLIPKEAAAPETTHPETAPLPELYANVPQLVEALERILSLADQLGESAALREAAARNARITGRYDLSEAYRASANRMRATQQSLIQEITTAFQNSPRQPERIFLQ